MEKLVRHFTRIGCSLLLKFYPNMQIYWYLHIRLFLILILSSGFVFSLFILSLVDLNKVYGLKNFQPPLPSKIFDRKGRLISELFLDQRIMIKQEDIPQNIKNAFIAMEDNHFYDHPGIDIQAILRAVLINLQAGGVKQGGSTITQQLAKVILTNRDRTYTRKAKEAILALYLDALYNKDEILTMYFNQIYFGHGNYGIEAAAKFYFEKSAKDLNIGEAALLASLPTAPNRFSPLKYPKASREKVMLVLMKMIDRNFISKQTAIDEYSNLLPFYAKINSASSETAFGRREDKAPYFTDFIRQRLEKEIGKTLLYGGGLSIHTSLDLDHQLAAQKSLWSGLKKQNAISRNYFFTKRLDFGKHYGDTVDLVRLIFDLPDFQQKKSIHKFEFELDFYEHLLDHADLLNFGLGGEINLAYYLTHLRQSDNNIFRYQDVEGAFIELDNETGEVTAMVGGNPFTAQNQLNRTVQIRRQPGSTFKPLLYAAALESGKANAATVYPDSPLVFIDIDGSDWIPENYTGSYNGFISLRKALALSANMVSIALAREVGLKNILPSLNNMLELPENTVPYNLSIALGSYEVSPLQMARAFALFARGGESLPIVYINKITDARGSIIQINDRNRKNTRQVIRNGTATVMSSMMEDVVNRGTASLIRSYYKGYAAGKTGTSQNFRDAWFVGYNQRYTAAVWIGYDRASLSLGPGVSGGGLAAPIWGEYQSRLAGVMSQDTPYLIKGGTFAVEVCEGSGKRPGSACAETCNERYTEIFVSGGSSPEECEKEVHHTDLSGSPEKKKKNTTITDDFFEGNN